MTHMLKRWRETDVDRIESIASTSVTGSPVRVWPSASASAFSARSAAVQPRSTSSSAQASPPSLSQLERSWPKIGVLSGPPSGTFSLSSAAAAGVADSGRRIVRRTGPSAGGPKPFVPAALATGASGGALVKESFAKKNGLQLGEQFILVGSGGDPVSLHVAGFYQPPRVAELLGGVIVSQSAFETAFPRAQNSFTLIDGSPTQSGLEQAVAGFPDTKVQTHAEFVKNQTSFMNSLLNLLYVLLALSVVISLFGMVNTLVLSVYERTREFGMLRAIGMSRRQARRMVRHESVVTALIGAALGIAVGVFLAILTTQALSDEGIVLAIPWTTIVVFVVATIFAGMLAAILPARRASRLNILQALQYE